MHVHGKEPGKKPGNEAIVVHRRGQIRRYIVALKYYFVWAVEIKE